MSSRKAKRFLFGLLVALGVGWISWSLFVTWQYRRALPAEIGVEGLVHTGSDFRLSDLLLLGAIRWEGCGGAIFQLTDDARRQIETQGLAFFRNARQGRGHPDNDYYVYQEWKETPVPYQWVSEGAWAGLACAFSSATIVRITTAARKSGSYYTTKREAQLLVIPSLGIVVFSYFG